MLNFSIKEKSIINITKYGAIFSTIIFSILVTFLLIKNQKEILKNDISNMEDIFVSQNKVKVENLVNNISNFINTERKFEEERLSRILKEHVYQAHAIANSIYNETSKNSNYSKDETIKLITESIRNIRFNDGLGYMFIFSMDGKSLLNAQFPEVEGINHWDYKDANGTLILQDMNYILNQKDETYYEWFWKKTKDDEVQYKKIGFFKKFEPLNMFIGTGDYVDEFEKNLKEKILFKINSLKFEIPSHLFIYDLNGLCLSNPKKELVGVNRLNVKNQNGDYIVKNIIDFATKNKEGFLEYNSSIKLNDSLVSNEKISYIKLIPEVNWIVGSGFYIEELRKQIEERKQSLQKTTDNTIKDIVYFSLVVTTIILIFSFYLSKIISNMFDVYKIRIKEETKKSFEKEKLMIQQSKMAIMGEMIANIAHQWKQPLNLISISNGLIKLNRELKDINTTEEVDKALENIDNSVKYLSHTIDDFRDFFKPDKEKSDFRIKEILDQTIKLISSQFKSNNIEILEEVEDLKIYGYKNELAQVLINILKNAKDELVKLDSTERKLVFIKVYEESNSAIIEIKDSAGGIPTEIIDRVFDAYFTTKEDNEGTGIGLYMSKQIIDGMSGKIEILNEKYEFEDKTYIGALFKVIIPL